MAMIVLLWVILAHESNGNYLFFFAPFKKFLDAKLKLKCRLSKGMELSYGKHQSASIDISVSCFHDLWLFSVAL